MADADGRSASIEVRALEEGRSRARARFENPQAGERAAERWERYLAGRTPLSTESDEASETMAPMPQDRLEDI